MRNTEAYEQLNKQKKTELLLDLQKQKSDLEKIYQDEIDKINEEADARNLLNGKVREYFILQQMSSNEALQSTVEQLAEIDGYISSLNAPTFDNDTKSSSDPWKDEFDDLYSQKKHDLEMNRITEEEYINWLDGAYKKYFSDMTKYQDEYNRYEEEVYKYRKDREQDLFDKKIENHKKLADNALDKNVDCNGNELKVTVSFDYARNEMNSSIEETQKRIDELRLRPGFEDEVESLIEDLEDLNDKLDEIDKKEIESEKDYIENLKDEFSDVIDDQIDSYKEESDEIEKALDKQIDLIDKQSDAYDKQIDALEKVNEAEKKKIDILEAQKKVKEAEIELEKAHVKNRLVYTGNGQWEAREDKDAVKEAEEKLAEAKAELEEKRHEEQKAILEEQKSALEDQKKLLEETKDNAKEYYSDITDNLKKQKETGEKTYDALIDILENVGDNTKQKTSNSELYKKLTESGDIKKAVENLSATEFREAIESGILKVDDKGDYWVDYSAIENNNEVVESNSDITKDNTEAINNFNETISQFMPDNSENAAINTPEGAQSENNSKVKPITYSEWQKRHTLSEYAPHGKDVPDMTFEEYLSGKELKTETIKSDIKHYGANGKISSSDVDNYFKEIVLDKFIKQITEGVSGVVPTANEIFGQQMKMIMGGQNINQGGVVNNVMNANGRPQFVCNINVEGSADEKTVDRMRSEIDNALCEYTDAMSRSWSKAFLQQKSRV